MHLSSAAASSTHGPHHAHLTYLTACHKVARHCGPILWGILVGALQAASPLALG